MQRTRWLEEEGKSDYSTYVPIQEKVLRLVAKNFLNNKPNKLRATKRDERMSDLINENVSHSISLEEFSSRSTSSYYSPPPPPTAPWGDEISG